MTPATSFESFQPLYNEGRPQLLWTKLVADLETPVSAMLKLADGKPNSILLESVEGGAQRGRYSFIGLKPDVIWRCHGDTAELNRSALHDPAGFVPCPVAEKKGALGSLRALVTESTIEDMPASLPPMAAGLVGYMGYDMVRLVEPVSDANKPRFDLPDGQFLRPTVMAIFDNVDDSVTLATPVRPRPGIDARAAYSMACERLADLVSDLDRSLPSLPASDVSTALSAEPETNMTEAEYCAMVEKAKDYIAAGDVFQVVLSQRMTLPFTLPPFALYRSLRRTNPSPFLVFLDFGDFALVGSSPEILVRLRDGKVTVRPIAGTRPRGADEAADSAFAADLLSDPKELAEHLMLLDLGRNDVGRVARTGTVSVTERNIIERYSHVMHIVSNVEGRLDSDKYDAMDALFAGFPAGTVSGAPKVRAMQIIEELEPDRRGPYAGCIGYFSANGSLDTCITLRTGLVMDGQLHIQAGAGIVADSVPASEHQECRNKARALLRAAEDAVKFAGRRRG
jgi:anthranilate synthase component 1